jgi:hypothetical protein
MRTTVDGREKPPQARTSAYGTERTFRPWRAERRPSSASHLGCCSARLECADDVATIDAARHVRLSCTTDRVTSHPTDAWPTLTGRTSSRLHKSTPTRGRGALPPVRHGQWNTSFPVRSRGPRLPTVHSTDNPTATRALRPAGFPRALQDNEDQSNARSAKPRLPSRCRHRLRRARSLRTSEVTCPAPLSTTCQDRGSFQPAPGTLSRTGAKDAGPCHTFCPRACLRGTFRSECRARYRYRVQRSSSNQMPAAKSSTFSAESMGRETHRQGGWADGPGRVARDPPQSDERPARQHRRGTPFEPCPPGSFRSQTSSEQSALQVRVPRGPSPAP